MYQLLDLKNMNLEEAVQLCKQEYAEEFRKTNMMPMMDGELEEYLTGFVGIAKKAPEEYIEGSSIDEQTNIFTLGALLFEFFGSYSPEEIGKRYRDNQFLPCSYSAWQLNEASYHVAVKAVTQEREERNFTFEEFYTDWKKAWS